MNWVALPILALVGAIVLGYARRGKRRAAQAA
jgi:hypothetical protein